jgi:hypothetical protein
MLPKLQYCSLQLGVDYDDAAPGAGLRAAGAISSLPIKTIDLAMCAMACESRKLYGHASIIQRAFSLLTLSTGLKTLNLHQYYGIRATSETQFQQCRISKTYVSPIVGSTSKLSNDSSQRAVVFGHFTTKPPLTPNDIPSATIL